MPLYKVTNIYKSTATLEVEADSRDEALRLALGMEDEPNHDESLYDSRAEEIDGD